MKTYTKLVSYISLCLFIATLIPLLTLGWYNHPTGDDYDYGVETKHEWESSHNLISVFKAAADGVREQYYGWQGTYSAMFLMYLPPNIFGANAYRFVTPAILSLLIAGLFFLTHRLLCGLLKASRREWIAIASLLSFLCIQSTPFASESYYWYNGSMYYTGYLGISLLFLGILCILPNQPRIFPCIISCLLALFLAGGNYVSLLPTMLLSFTCLGLVFFKKVPGKYCLIAPCAFLCIGFLISAMAPGNQVRQNDLWKIPAVTAILKSIRQGFYFLRGWTSLWLLLVLFILTPIFWNICKRLSFGFPYPFLVIGYGFGILCSTACPTYYTMNSTGPARAAAIMFYAFMLFLFFAYFYFLGFLHRVLGSRNMALETKLRELGWKPFLIALPILFLLTLLFGNVPAQNFARASKALLSGSAAAYEKQYRERLLILSDPAQRDIVFTPYESPTDLIYVGDFTGDPNNSTNQRIAAYFDKDSIRVKYD